MRVQLITAPTLECVSLAELKLHLRIDSGAFVDNIDETQSIAPGSYPIDYELMTLNVAPGGAGWAVGDTITGVTSSKTCIIVTVITTLTYIVKSRSGAYTLGEVLTNGTATADQGTAYPTFATGYRILGTAVEVLGYEATVVFNAGQCTATGTVDAKIQESDDNSTWTDWTGGAFTQVTTTNDNAIQEKAYTGTKRYIRTIAQVATAACQFGTTIIRLNPQSAEDDLLNDLIETARGHVEDITRRAIITQTWDYYLDGWPNTNYIKLPFGNLQNAVGTAPTISWKDDDGTETTLTVTTDYLVETNGDGIGRIVLPYAGTWPSGTLYPSNPIKIQFICGWTAASLVPAKIRTAIKMLAAKAYEDRGEDAMGQQVTEDKFFMRLLQSTRLWDEF